MWSVEKANEWYQKHSWTAGFQYVPGCPEKTAEELSAAAKVGYNACRVMLSRSLWAEGKDTFFENLEEFFCTASEAGLAVVPVLLDDSCCADLKKSEQYVKEVIAAFQKDDRILFWDLYNEPGKTVGKDCLSLLKSAFAWAESAEPVQPLTAGVWSWEEYDLPCLELSDILSFHDDSPLHISKQRTEELLKKGRPVFCTEWLNRSNNNTFETHLPYYRLKKVGTFHRGLVGEDGVFCPDLTPCRPSEFVLLRQLLREDDSPCVELKIPVTPMTPEVMKRLDELGLITLICPDHDRLEIPEEGGQGSDVYVGSPEAGPHKLITVAITRTQFSAFGYHDENEEFILLGGVNERPLDLLISYRTVEELEKKLADGTVSAKDFICLRCCWNDPYASFFTMNKGVPHGEAAGPGPGRPATFYVTEAAGIKLLPIPLGTITRTE